MEQETPACNSKSSAFFSADQPISAAADDRLHRAPFAAALAEQLATAPANDGFVVGLFGPWGNGKTSLLNMVDEDLGKRATVAVVRFNPWLFTGAEQLVFRFFSEIAAELRIHPGGRVTRLAEQLATFGETLGAVDVVPIVGTIGKLSGHLRGFLRRRRQPESAVAQRDQLKRTLRQLDRRVIVLIDDIDRLRSEEIRDVMRLVRLTADLPNMVFLLAFDRQRVENALEEAGTEGRAYLAKILQLTYDVPSIRGPDLSTFLLNGIDRVIDGQLQGPFDGRVWQNSYGLILRPLFDTVREVKRYLNALPVTMQNVGDEVALADLLTLEAIRSQLPDVFALLPSSIEALTSTRDLGSGRPDLSPEIEGILKSAGTHEPEVRQLLIHLFPASRRYVDKNNFGPEWMKEWSKNRRVAHERVLRFYLERTLPDGELPAREVQALFEALPDPARLRGVLDALDADHLERVFSRLEDFEDEFPPDCVSAALPVFMAQQRRLREGREHGPGDFGADLALSRIVLRLMRRVPDVPTRDQVLRDSLPAIPTLSGRLDILDTIGHRESVGSELISLEAWEASERDLCVAVLEADPEALGSERDLLQLFLRAQHRAEAEEQNALRALATQKPILLRLIACALSEGFSQTIGEAAVRRQNRLAWDVLERIVGADQLSEKVAMVAREVSRESLDERTATALSIAQRYADGWRPRRNLFGAEDPDD